MALNVPTRTVDADGEVVVRVGRRRPGRPPHVITHTHFANVVADNGIAKSRCLGCGSLCTRRVTSLARHILACSQQSAKARADARTYLEHRRKDKTGRRAPKNPRRSAHKPPGADADGTRAGSVGDDAVALDAGGSWATASGAVPVAVARGQGPQAAPLPRVPATPRPEESAAVLEAYMPVLSDMCKQLAAHQRTQRHDIARLAAEHGNTVATLTAQEQQLQRHLEAAGHKQRQLQHALERAREAVTRESAASREWQHKFELLVASVHADSARGDSWWERCDGIRLSKQDVRRALTSTFLTGASNRPHHRRTCNLVFVTLHTPRRPRSGPHRRRPS